MSTVKSKQYQIGTDASASNNFTIYQPSTPDGTLRIGQGTADNPTEVVKVDGSGNLTPTGGIYLGGTGSANLLDDYETGDYTPSLTQGGTAMTVASATGHYIKIGHLVWATWLITNITKTGTGALKVSLPFVVDGHGYGAAQANRMTFATNDRQMVWIALNNTSTAGLYFNQTGDANSSTVIASDLANNTAADIYGTVMYRTD